VEGGAGRRRGIGNKEEGARGAPMAGDGAVLTGGGERAREKAGGCARGGGENGERASAVHRRRGRSWRRRARMPTTRRRWPDTVGRARRGRVRARGGRWTRVWGGRAGFAGWAGWLAPANQ